MKVLHFYNGSDFFTDEVPFFEWDNEGAKLIKGVATDAYYALGPLSGCDNYTEIKKIYDKVKNLRICFEYRRKQIYDIPELVNKGYKVYCEVLDNIITKLAASLFSKGLYSTADNENEKSYYGRKIMDYEMEAYAILGKLKDGKIDMTMKDGKTRTFEYIYTTANELDYRGLLFYAPETRKIKDFEGEVERKLFKR